MPRAALASSARVNCSLAFLLLVVRGIKASPLLVRSYFPVINSDENGYRMRGSWRTTLGGTGHAEVEYSAVVVEACVDVAADLAGTEEFVECLCAFRFIRYIRCRQILSRSVVDPSQQWVGSRTTADQRRIFGGGPRWSAFRAIVDSGRFTKLDAGVSALPVAFTITRSSHTQMRDNCPKITTERLNRPRLVTVVLTPGLPLSE
jgi:hypothetical protein